MLSRRKFLTAAGLGIGAIAATGVVCGKAESQPPANLDPAEIIVVDMPDQDRTIRRQASAVYISLPQNRFWLEEGKIYEGVGFGTSRQALIDRAGKYPISLLKTQPTPWIVLMMSEHTEVVVPEQHVKFTRHTAITNTASNDEYWQITNLAGDLPIYLASSSPRLHTKYGDRYSNPAGIDKTKREYAGGEYGIEEVFQDVVAAQWYFRRSIELYPEAIEVVVPEQHVKFTRHTAITNTASNDEYWQISFTCPKRGFPWQRNLAGDLPISLATACQLFTPSWICRAGCIEEDQVWVSSLSD